jgi:hypothetical protein
MLEICQYYLDIQRNTIAHGNMSTKMKNSDSGTGERRKKKDPLRQNLI